MTIPITASAAAALFIALAPFASCEARAQVAAASEVDSVSSRTKALEALLFPNGQDYVIRFDSEEIVGQGRALNRTKWEPGGPLSLDSRPFRKVLGGDFVEAGRGMARGRPPVLVQLYARSLEPFFGHPDQVLRAAFSNVQADEQLMVVERPNCIVVASHKGGHISRMATVTHSETLNHVHNESNHFNEVKARAADCSLRTEIAAMGGWGIFFTPASALIETVPDSFGGLSELAVHFEADQFEADAPMLSKIRAGLTRKEFRDMMAERN